MSISALTGCGPDKLDIDVDVVISRRHDWLGDVDTDVLSVYPRFAGEACACMEVSETPRGCSASADLAVECECAATCFESARVERAGRTLGSTDAEVDYGAAAFEVSEPIETGDVLVIDACGAERRVPLEVNDLDPLRGGSIMQRGDEFGVTWEPDPDARYSTVSFGVGVDAWSCSTAETEHWIDRATVGPPQENFWDARLSISQVEAHSTVDGNLFTARRFVEETISTPFTLPRYVGSGRYEIQSPRDVFEIRWGGVAPAESAWFQILDDGGVSLEVRAGAFSLSTGPGFARASYRDVVVELPALPLDPLFSDPFEIPREVSFDYGTVAVEDPSNPSVRREWPLVLAYRPPFAKPLP